MREGGCRSTGIGMDGVIAVFWTDLDPGKVTDCPQTHHCGGGGNVYYKTERDRLVRAAACALVRFALLSVCDWCGCWCRAQIIEYAAVQSWSWNNQYNLPDPGQTFEAVLWDNGDVLFQYLDMCAPLPLSLSSPVRAHSQPRPAAVRYCKHCSTAWSTVSVGFEDQSGLRGQQIEYGDIPDDGTAYFIPSAPLRCVCPPLALVFGLWSCAEGLGAVRWQRRATRTRRRGEEATRRRVTNQRVLISSNRQSLLRGAGSAGFEASNPSGGHAPSANRCIRPTVLSSPPNGNRCRLTSPSPSAGSARSHHPAMSRTNCVGSTRSSSSPGSLPTIQIQLEGPVTSQIAAIRPSRLADAGPGTPR